MSEGHATHGPQSESTVRRSANPTVPLPSRSHGEHHVIEIDFRTGCVEQVDQADRQRSPQFGIIGARRVADGGRTERAFVDLQRVVIHGEHRLARQELDSISRESGQIREGVIAARVADPRRQRVRRVRLQRRRQRLLHAEDLVGLDDREEDVADVASLGRFERVGVRGRVPATVPDADVIRVVRIPSRRRKEEVVIDQDRIFESWVLGGNHVAESILRRSENARGDDEEVG
jgi:hypothetical protein